MTLVLNFNNEKSYIGKKMKIVKLVESDAWLKEESEIIKHQFAYKGYFQFISDKDVLIIGGKLKEFWFVNGLTVEVIE